GPFGAALRPHDGSDLLPRNGTARARSPVRVEGATSAPSGRDDDASGGTGREGGGSRDHPRGHEHDGRGSPPREQARTPPRPRRGGNPIVRQDDGRRSEPDHRGSTGESPVRADGDVTRKPAARERDRRRPSRRQQRD